MIITGTCRICGGRSLMDVGDLKQKEIEAWMKKAEFGHCSVGYHVEIGKMSDYYTMDFDHRFASMQEAQNFIEEEKVTADEHNNHSSIRG